MKYVKTFQAVQFMDAQRGAVGILRPSQNPHEVSDSLAEEVQLRGLGVIVVTEDQHQQAEAEEARQAGGGQDAAGAESGSDASEAQPLVQAMLALDAADSSNWTDGGKPQLKPLTQAMKRPVSATERDEAWAIAGPMRAGTA